MLEPQNSGAQYMDFRYGRSTIAYRLIREERKNLAITVNPDKTVVVKAPMQSASEEIEARLQKRGGWILKQLNYFDKFHPLQPERQYISGETHYFLGRQYRLRIRQSGEENVKLIGKFFIVKTSKPDDRVHIRQLMTVWYAAHAQLVIDRRASRYIENILGPGYARIEIKYRFMKSRWGSYAPEDKSITFNIELVKTPLNCVDYVIVHELCHIVHPNHDKAFYRLLEKTLPEWRATKEKLELFGAR